MQHPGYQFDAGPYSILVFAHVVGRSTPIKLDAISLTLSKGEAEYLGGASWYSIRTRVGTGNTPGMRANIAFHCMTDESPNPFVSSQGAAATDARKARNYFELHEVCSRIFSMS